MGRTPADPEWEPPAQRERFIANIIESVNGDETCTISPPPTNERILLAEWISAHGESFVSLEQMR